jgi:hypothetical protein
MSPIHFEQPDLFGDGGDERFSAQRRLLRSVRRYASGLSRPNDFTTVAWAGHGIGVEAGELSSHAITQLARCVVDYRADLFVDTGAYGAYRRAVRGAPPVAIDFARVFTVYDRLLQAIADANEAEVRLPAPLLVMPDVVTDQIASLALVAEHAAYVRAAVQFSGVCRAVIPLHSGPHSLAHVYHRLVDLLGSDDWIVGLPTNAAAVSPAEFTDFLRAARPRSVHLLGAFADSRLIPRLNQALDAGHPSLALSADGNPLRSIIVERGQGRSARHEALRFKLGRSARACELASWLAHLGGETGLAAAYHRASPDDKARIVGLIADLSDCEPAAARRRFQLWETPPALAA